jgi:hypothetical protein
MKRSARPFRLALLVERAGDLKSIGVDFDDGVDRGAGFVDLLNAGQVFLGERAGGILPGLETGLGVVDRDLVQFEVFAKFGAAAGAGSETRAEPSAG